MIKLNSLSDKRKWVIAQLSMKSMGAQYFPTHQAKEMESSILSLHPQIQALKNLS